MKERNQRKDFGIIPGNVIESAEFLQLSGVAVELLQFLACSYNGHNNGDLSAPMSRLRELGFNSEASLNKARRELLNTGMILETRPARFLRDGPQCALYALAWQPINECNGKHLLQPTIRATGKFKAFRDKHGRHKGRFAYIPTKVLYDPKRIQLGYNAKKLLLLYQYAYRPKQNGNLFISDASICSFGIKSKSTRRKALNELLQSGLLVCTREGKFGQNRVEPRYAIGWEDYRDDFDQLSPTKRNQHLRLLA